MGKITEKNDILKPSLDLVFKKIFADEKNNGLLRDFLISILEFDKNKVGKVEVKNP